MIYIISKATFGSYNIHDIQSNSCWTECALDGYAVIPENLVESILATKGFCDIVLNEEESEVVSFAAREIPDAPDCQAVRFVTSRDFQNYWVNLGGLTESLVYPGCYYRVVDGVEEWENPPMEPLQLYKTTKRHCGKPVYAYWEYLGCFLNNGYGDNCKTVILSIGSGIKPDQYVSIMPIVRGGGRTHVGGVSVPKEGGSAMYRIDIQGTKTVEMHSYTDLSDYDVLLFVEFTL